MNLPVPKIYGAGRRETSTGSFCIHIETMLDVNNMLVFQENPLVWVVAWGRCFDILLDLV